MGGLIQKGTQALGLTADPNTGSGAMQQSSALQERAVRELEKIGIPTIEAQKIVLQNPELILSSEAEKLGSSAMEDIQIDPRLVEAQNAALADLQEAGEKGFTAEDRARIEALRTQIGSDEKARQASILQGMAERGSLDSGAQLAAQLGSSQAATQRASQEGVQLAAQQAAARRNALAQAGQLAGQMGSTQFGQQAQKASAADAIKQFNAAVAARDTAAKQQQAQQVANTANQQEMYNKGLVQQQFQNEMARATGISGALGNQAQGAMNQAQMQAQAAQQAAAGTRGLVIGGAQAAATAFSDKRLKKNIDGISSSSDSEKLHKMFDKAQPYEYDYKDEKYGEGKHNGLMAQDLEKSEIGKNFVIDTPEGKMVDYGKMSSTLAAGMSDLHKRVKELEGKKEGKKYFDGGRSLMAGEGMDVGSALNTEAEVEQANKEISNEDKKTASLQDILKSFNKGYEQGSALIKPAEVGNINPIKIQAPQQSTQSMNSLQAIRQKLLGQAMANGGMKDHQGMNYNAGGEGVVIKSLEDSYAGDELPDRINDGEMVLNLDQQDTFNSLLKELGERRRADEKVNNGEATINESQQDKLMAVARKEAQPEDLVDNGGNIVEDIEVTNRPQIGQEEAMPTDVNQIEDLLKALKMSEEGYEFADGGQKYGDIDSYAELGFDYHDENPIQMTDELAKYRNQKIRQLLNEEGEQSLRGAQYLDRVKLTPDENLIRMQQQLKENPSDKNLLEEAIIKNIEEGQKYADGGIEDLLSNIKTPYSDMMSREETPEEKALDLDTILSSTQPEQNMSIGEPAKFDYSKDMSVGEPAQVPTIEQANKQVQSANAPKTPEATKEDDVEKTDDELKSAQNKDMWLTLLGNIDKALSHYDAANPNAKLTPVQRDMIKADFEDKLLKARQMAAQREDKKELKNYKDRELKLKEREVAAKEKVANQNRVNLSDEEKIKLQSKLKEDVDIRKEERKTQVESKESLRNIDEYLKEIDNAIKLTKKAEKANLGVGTTGPVVGRLTPNLSDLSQELKQAYNKVSFTNFVEKAKGMSKAFDSEEERRFYEMTQPNEEFRESTNLKNLQSIKENILKKKADIVKSSLNTKNSTEEKPKKTTEIRRRTKDGKIAIFNENKEFLRYE